MSNGAAAIARLSAYGLLMTALVFGYLNTTTSVFLWSTIYIAGTVICTLAAAAKLASAEGIENDVVRWADNFASIVPFVAISACVYQGAHYMQPGMSGFMACVAIMAGVFNVFFGVWDAFASILGSKFDQLGELANRMAEAGDVVLNGHDHSAKH